MAGNKVPISIILWAFWGTGCFPLAPPVKTSFGVMPESQGYGNVSLTAGYGLYEDVHVREGTINMGVSDHTDAVFGGVWLEDLFVHNLGLRYQMLSDTPFPLAVAGGYGVAADGTDLSYGGHVDVSLGWRPSQKLGVYLGNRYQLAWQSEVPTTHYGHHAVGVQLELIPDLLFASAESGYYYFGNTEGFVHGPSYIFIALGARIINSAR